MEAVILIIKYESDLSMTNIFPIDHVYACISISLSLTLRLKFSNDVNPVFRLQVDQETK